jgi:hypothetical protein
MGNKSVHLMDTINAKKRWATIYWPSIIFEREPPQSRKTIIKKKEPHSDRLCQRASIIIEN